MNKFSVYLLSSASVLVCCSNVVLATDNVDAPMPIFPRGAEKKISQPVTPPAGAATPTTAEVDKSANGLTPPPKPPEVPVPTDLVLTASYFSTEPNPKHALQEAREQQGAHFNEPAFYYRKACILIQLKNYSLAEQELKNLISDIPNNSDYHLARAYCYYKMGNKTGAVDEIATARFHNPRLPKNIEIGN